MNQVASANKIAYHKEKLAAYLANQPVFPVTVEMDLTTQCTRICNDCPSCRSPYHRDLSMNFIENLFASFEGQTKGLLLTGGEPTMALSFPSVLELARRQGFEEIAVVTNGSLLHEERVINALLQHASTIRVSMYDWDSESCGGIGPTLGKITKLRKHIDQEGSALKIGVSALTSKERAPRLPEIADAVKNAGAHWVYYHPMCTGWADSNLKQVDQSNVLETVSEYRKQRQSGFEAFISQFRYASTEIQFDGYHSAHFMLVVGADGVNYLGAEVKYQSRFAIADVAGEWRSDFLQAPERLAKIHAVNSRTYSALNSRHRGVLYNDNIEKLKNGNLNLNDISDNSKTNAFLFPHIL